MITKIHTIHRLVLALILITLGMKTFYPPQAYAQTQNTESELFLVAQKAFEDGFYDVAMRYIEQLFSEYPQTNKHIQAKLLLGQCYFFKTQYLKAYDIFQKLLKHSEFKDVTLFWIGETYLKGAAYAQAEKHYLELLDLYPDSDYAPQALYSLGWSYQEQDKSKQAKESFLKLIRSHPTHPLAENASFKLAEAEYKMLAYENTIEYFKEYVLRHPNSRRHAQAYFYIGESYYYLNHYLNAVTYYAKAAEIAYDNKLILMSKVSLGWSYLKLERFKLSQQYFDEAYQFAETKNLLSDDIFLGQATLHAEIGNHSQAIKAYRSLIAQFPKSERILDAYLGLANTYYQTKQYTQAINAYTFIIQRSEEKPLNKDLLEKTYFGLAWAYLKNGNIDSAVDSFQTIREKTENKTIKISALTQIGDAYQDAEQLKKAVSVYDTILQNYPESAYTDYVQYRQGIALLKMGNVDVATLSFQSLQNNFPTSKYLNDVNYYLGVAYFKKDDWTTSKEYIDDFINGSSQSSEFLAEAYYIRALSFFNMKQYKEAIKAFNKILKDYSSDVALVKRSKLYIAQSYYNNGNIERGLKEFDLLADMYPNSTAAQEAMISLGDHYFELSEFDQAILFYQKFINRYPGSENIDLIYFELGRAHQASEAYEQAVDAFKRISPDNDSKLYAQAHLAIADIFSKELDPLSAIETYQNIIKTSPEFKRDAYIKIAEFYAKESDYPQTIATYKNALKSNSTTDNHSNAELQFLIADAYQLLNQHDEAVNEYLKISYLYPKETNWIIKAYLRMARIFENNEQWEQASMTYEKIIQFKTDESKFARERLEWINTNAHN